MPLKPGLGQRGVRTLASSPATAESAAAVAHTSSEKREGRKYRILEDCADNRHHVYNTRILNTVNIVARNIIGRN